jgi:hypothetical protein
MESPLSYVGRGGLSACLLIAIGCQPPPHFVPGPAAGAGANGPGGDGGTAVANVAHTPRRLRRLSNREYDNVVRDLIGDTTAPATGFLADAFVTGYDNGSADLIVQSDQVASFQLAAEALAATAVDQRPDLLYPGCDPARQEDDACAAAFLGTFAPRAFRRPLTVTETARLRGVYDQGASAGGFQLGIEMALETVLQSPQFLYREELGAAAGPGLVRLDAYERASELSFLVTGSMPDDVLWLQVKAGRFETAEDFQREAARLLATPAARANLRAFFHEWLATNRLIPTMAIKDVNVYPAWDRTLLASMAGELDRLFDDVVLGEAGSLRALFSTPEAYVDPALAAIYGVTGPDEGFMPIALDPAVRPGVLSRAGYLAVHSDSDSSGPIARGVFLMSAILCYPPLVRPATVPPAPSVSDTNKAGETTRQRFSAHATNSGCIGCHQIIDGIGFGFEAFDGVGVRRTTENGNPIDASGMLIGTGEATVDGPFEDVAGLVARMLTGHRLSDCFTRQMFRFAMGTIETEADLPLLNQVAAAFTVDSRMTDLLVALVASTAFTDRITLEAAP